MGSAPRVWRSLREAATRIPNRSSRFLAREIKAGRLRAARVGGRGEYVTCDEWMDDWMDSLVVPVDVPFRRRA